MKLNKVGLHTFLDIVLKDKLQRVVKTAILKRAVICIGSSTLNYVPKKGLEHTFSSPYSMKKQMRTSL